MLLIDIWSLWRKTSIYCIHRWQPLGKDAHVCQSSVMFFVVQYLESVRPLMDDAQYEHKAKLAAEFESSLGNRLQWYLKLKALWVTNYVSNIHT